MQEILLFMQQHAVLSILLIVALILLTIIEFVKQKSGGDRVTPAKLTSLMNHQDAVVVDIRPSEAYGHGHIINAVSLPFANIEAKIKKIEKFKSQPIVIVCENGTESARAAILLQNKGFKTYILNGGLRSWKMDQLPLVKE